MWRTVRHLLGFLVPIVLLTMAIFYFSPAGTQSSHVQTVRRWIEAQPALAPLVFIGVYCITSLLALPVWWLQILAGTCFGVIEGLFWCHLAAIVSAAATMRLADWLLGDWMRQRIEPYYRRLGRMDAQLGHNALLVVTLARFSTVMPFGITNYLFGLTRISLASVIVGTILGGTLMKMIYVGMGADPRLLASPRYLAILVGVNLLLVSPLLLRYLRPAWFRRAGIE